MNKFHNINAIGFNIPTECQKHISKTLKQLQTEHTSSSIIHDDDDDDDDGKVKLSLCLTN
jgi:hypothetical protein